MSKFFVFAIVAVTFAFPLYYDSDLIFQDRLKSREPAQAPFHSATEQEMGNPRCINQDHVRRNNLQAFLKKYSDLSNAELPSTYEVAGIHFEDEHPELIYRFMQLVTKPDGAAGQVFGNKTLTDADIKKAFGDARGCTKVLCAVQKIFGQEEGPLILLLLTEYDLNLSHLVWENASKWKAAEIRDILKAIEAVPSHLLPLDLNQKLIHFKRGFGYANGEGTIANASIEVFDVWNSESAPIRQYSIYHEFAHNWSALHSNSTDVSPEWLRISGWEGKTDGDKSKYNTDWRLHPGTQTVSIYAKTNPFEDFAESVSAYRYAPQRLKQVSAEKYKFVKDIIYGGMEFTGGCPDVKASPYEKDFMAFNASVDDQFVQKTAASCFISNLKVMEEPSLKSGFISCLNIKSAQAVLRSKGQVHDEGNKPLALYGSFDEARYRFLNVERAGVTKLRDLVLKLEEPHMKSLQNAVNAKSCKYAFSSDATETQAKALGVDSFKVYFAVQKMNARLCEQFVTSGERRVSEDSLKKQLAKFF